MTDAATLQLRISVVNGVIVIVMSSNIGPMPMESKRMSVQLSAMAALKQGVIVIVNTTTAMQETKIACKDCRSTVLQRCHPKVPACRSIDIVHCHDCTSQGLQRCHPKVPAGLKIDDCRTHRSQQNSPECGISVHGHLNYPRVRSHVALAELTVLFC